MKHAAKIVVFGEVPMMLLSLLAASNCLVILSTGIAPPPSPSPRSPPLTATPFAQEMPVQTDALQQIGLQLLTTYRRELPRNRIRMG